MAAQMIKDEEDDSLTENLVHSIDRFPQPEEIEIND